MARNAQVTGKPGLVIDEFTVDNDHGYGNLAHKQFTRGQAIREFCNACQGGHRFAWRMADGTVDPPRLESEAVKACTTKTCFLWPYRTGRGPRKRAVETR